MTYKNAIDRILERADMNNVSNGEALARTFFYDAMAELSEKPEFTQNDLRDYIIPIDYLVSGASITFAQLNTKITGTDCIDKVVDVFDLDNGILLNNYQLIEVKQKAYSNNINQSSEDAGWYQIGNIIYLVNSTNLDTKTIVVIVKLKTRIFASSGSSTADTPGSVSRILLDTDELNKLYSEQFVIQSIKYAVEEMKKSVEYNR